MALQLEVPGGVTAHMCRPDVNVGAREIALKLLGSPCESIAPEPALADQRVELEVVGRLDRHPVPQLDGLRGGTSRSQLVERPELEVGAPHGDAGPAFATHACSFMRCRAALARLPQV